MEETEKGDGYIVCPLCGEMAFKQFVRDREYNELEVIAMWVCDVCPFIGLECY